MREAEWSLQVRLVHTDERAMPPGRVGQTPRFITAPFSCAWCCYVLYRHDKRMLVGSMQGAASCLYEHEKGSRVCV